MYIYIFCTLTIKLVVRLVDGKTNAINIQKVSANVKIVLMIFHDTIIVLICTFENTFYEQCASTFFLMSTRLDHWWSWKIVFSKYQWIP